MIHIVIIYHYRLLMNVAFRNVLNTHQGINCMINFLKDSF